MILNYEPAWASERIYYGKAALPNALWVVKQAYDMCLLIEKGVSLRSKTLVLPVHPLTLPMPNIKSRCDIFETWNTC